MAQDHIAIVGGGAAGFFAAITCAEAQPAGRVTIFERGSQFLTKVKISGGGRCNVTHSCFDPRALAESYPRGARALISPFHRFAAADTVAWFEQRGIQLKTEPDGRIFPVSDSSETIVQCLLDSARAAGVQLRSRTTIDRIARRPDGAFELISGHEVMRYDRVLLAMGGCRAPGAIRLLESLGHRPVPPVPSLFSFHLPDSPLRQLPGTSVPDVEVSGKDLALRARGPLLITHQGVSGPAILRLSAWGARELAERDYRFTLRIRWLPDSSEEQLREELQQLRTAHPNRRVRNSGPPQLPTRLWEMLTTQAGIEDETSWTRLTREHSLALVRLLSRTECEVNGKSLNKDEFVTCGGVDLREVDFKTMQSRIVPGLYVAGELLDVDGITGGFNFQAAWTTGWIAGNAMVSQPQQNG